jgi:hypothetical protein
MTDIAQRINTAKLVAAAFLIYADAIRLGQTPTPNYITLHTAAMDPKDLMALADRIDARIEIKEPSDGAEWKAYACIGLPFGGDILPDGITALVHATCPLTEQLRKDITTHNDECIGRAIDEAATEGRATMSPAQHGEMDD